MWPSLAAWWEGEAETARGIGPPELALASVWANQSHHSIGGGLARRELALKHQVGVEALESVDARLNPVGPGRGG